jgi:hypothetical protein
MKQLPSIKSLATITDRPKDLRRLLEIHNSYDLAGLLPKCPSAEQWLRECHNKPSFHEIKMSMINEFLGTHGVEYIRAGRGTKSPAIEYCNAGDSYAPTILFVKGTYRVGDWGSIVERGNYA